ncbi:MAG: NifU family protein [Ignavibacteria bacterium]|nr:NifU family protein [Ignavibacteria bacterium]
MSEITRGQINEVLNKIRPYLQIDGGDVEFVGISEDKIVSIRLLGACNTCPLNLMTLRAGIERQLMIAFPDIVRVESVA